MIPRIPRCVRRVSLVLRCSCKLSPLHDCSALVQCRYRRQQLVQVQQVDGKCFWVDLLELAGNSSCMVVAHNPTCFPQTHSLKWLDTGSVVPKQQVLQLDLPEPTQVLVGLSMGPQHVLQPQPPPVKKVSNVCWNLLMQMVCASARHG